MATEQPEFSPYGELWKLTFGNSVSDDKTVKFFRQDRASQTEISEILEVKELSDAVTKLNYDCHELRRDVNLTKGVLKSEFSHRLQDRALELYSRMNDRIGELERSQSDRVDVVRRAFRVQMTEALIKVHDMYGQHYKDQMKDELDRQVYLNKQKETMIRELKSLVTQHEQKISSLQKKLDKALFELKEALSRQNDAPEMVYIMPDIVRQLTPSPPPAPPPPKDPSPPPPPQSPKISKKEFEAKLTEIQRLQERIKQLESQIIDKQTESGSLAVEREEFQHNLQRLQELNKQLTMERDHALARVEEMRINAESQSSASLEKQEKNLKDRLFSADKKAKQTLADAIQAIQLEERQKYNKLQAQKDELEATLRREREAHNQAANTMRELEASKKREAMLMTQINRLKSELANNNKTWEKKFAILRQTLHALKDESYIRQNLQRQAAQLHQAAIMYAADVPMGVLASQAQATLGKQNIKQTAGSGDNQRFTYTSHGSQRFNRKSASQGGVETVGDRQVVDDDWPINGDLPPGIRPLPSPPTYVRSHNVTIRPAN